jgi:GntR family transcriptional regulator/MocR family aminotransferase
MSKRATALPLTLSPRPPGTPAYRWLYGALREQILAGGLRPGARLPGTRELAAHYALSRGTVVAAFDQLQAEGYVEGSVGSGTHVSSVLPEQLLQAPRAVARRPAAVPPPQRRLSAYARRLQALPWIEVRPTRAFRANLPALDLFPTELWAQLAARRLRRASASDLLGCDPFGYGPLRAAIADYLVTSRGVRCTAEQVIVVSGVQEALDLAARLLLDAGDEVAMEDPGYDGAAAVFAAVGARICCLPLDDEGVRLPAGRRRRVRLLYVTPAHQFPLCTTMSLPRRLQLVDWARTSGALIFEDDYDSEYRYSGRPVPALQGLDRSGAVLFAGSFSKVLFPSLRLGYLVVPEDLMPRFLAAKSVSGRAPLLEQAMLTDFMAGGHFGRHLRRMRQVYGERLGVLLAEASRRLAGKLEICAVEAGLQTAGWLGDHISAVDAAAAAAARGVEVTPLSRYDRGSGCREGLQLGFAALDPDEIRRGVRELAAALDVTAKPRRRERR